jgi:hypothetical protein
LLMPVPTVSPRMWKRTRALSHLAMATPQVNRDDFSFSTHVESLCGRNWKKEAEETDGDSMTHKVWENDHVERLEVPERERAHRPEIDDDLDEALTETVRDNYSAVPAEQLPFEQRLTLVVDAAEEYFEVLDCYVEWVNLPNSNYS